VENPSPSPSGPLRRSSGSTRTERFLARLAEDTFLSLWSYPNLYRKSGKELCDLLVVFGNHIIVFSDKESSFHSTKSLAVAWNRWFRKSVKDSATQLWGAERSLRTNPKELYLDVRASKPYPFALPEPLNWKIHLVAVANGISGPCVSAFGGSGTLMFRNTVQGLDQHTDPFTIGELDPSSTFVHVFDDVSLQYVMKLMDTVSDFTSYLEKRERFLRSNVLVNSAGEEELLSFYMKNLNAKGEHDFVLPPEVNALTLTEGLWHAFENSPERKAQVEADKISYNWDSLINVFGRHALAGTSERTFPVGVGTTEKIMRFLASQSRLRRRVLASAFLDLIASTPPDKMKFRFIAAKQDDGVFFAFLVFPVMEDKPYEDYRKVRVEALGCYCKTLRLRIPDAKDIIGIATESGRMLRAEGSEDAIYLDGRVWTEEDRKDAEGILEMFGLKGLPSLSPTNVKEFPIREFQKDSKGQQPSRNAPCPCGSRKRFRKCHGRKQGGGIWPTR